MFQQPQQRYGDMNDIHTRNMDEGARLYAQTCGHIPQTTALYHKDIAILVYGYLFLRK